MQRTEEGLAETPRAIAGREHLITAKSSPPLPRPPRAVLVGLRAGKMEAGRGKGASHGMVTRSRAANPTASHSMSQQGAPIYRYILTRKWVDWSPGLSLHKGARYEPRCEC